MAEHDLNVNTLTVTSMHETKPEMKLQMDMKSGRSGPLARSGALLDLRQKDTKPPRQLPLSTVAVRAHQHPVFVESIVLSNLGVSIMVF